MVKGKVFEVELCEELYREMSVEEFIRRGMRMLLVMILFLSMVLGVSLMTPGKGLTVIDMKYAGTLSLQDGILPDVFGNYEAEVVLPMEEKTADLPAAVPDEMIVFTPYVMIYEEVLIPDHGETDKGDPADFFQVIPEQITEEEVLTRQDTGVVLSAEESPMSIPAAETPTLSIPEASVPENDIPVPDLAGPDSSEPDVPAVENGLTDAPAADIPELGDGTSDLSGEDIPVSDVPAADIPVSDEAEGGTVTDDQAEEEAADPGLEEDTGTEGGTDAGVSGFIVDESGMIRGISDMSLAASDLCLYLPAEGCTGIAYGAFAGVAEEIVDVYIPSNITNIEEGAFLGLPYVCKYEVESGNSMYYTENGVMFSEGGSCLLAFPSGRTGTYFVPAGVTRFANDAFAGSMLSKLDTRSCTLEDMGNLPESISIQ